MNKILITGAVGFIGFHLAKRLLEDKNNTVFGIDNFSDYYDVNIKYSRLNILKEYSNFVFKRIDICKKYSLVKCFENFKPDIVINLAAQAGVRYSLTNPDAYIDTNIQGFVNVLEACKFSNVKHLVFASSSSVYGANIKKPFSIKDMTDYPISLYGATKKANELLAHSYSSMYNIPCSGVRFFSVYGTYGRPDLALFIFTKNILDGIPITIYGDGESSRAYTYVDDVIDCVTKIINVIPNSKPPYEIYNIGSGNPIKLNKFIELIENNLNIKAIKNYVSMQIGDIQEAFSDDDNKMFESKIPVEEGVKLFVDWFKKYYKKE